MSKIKISENTLQIIKNATRICSNTEFKDGNVQLFADNIKHPSIMLRAELEETFDKNFLIFNLSRFVQILNFMKEPDLKFKDNYISIQNKDSKIKYAYGTKEFVNTSDIRDFNLKQEPICEFVITGEQLLSALKISSITNYDCISFIVEDGVVYIKTFKEGVDDLSYKHKIGKVDSDDMEKTFDISKIVFLPSEEYKVKLYDGIGSFELSDFKVTYFVGGRI